MSELSSVNQVRHKKIVFLVSISFALILLSSSFSFVSFGASPTFTPAINLSNDAGMATEPEVANNGQNVYVAWTEGGAGIFFRESPDGGVTWVPPVTSSALKLSVSGGTSQFPVMYTQFESVNSGDVYVAWSQSVTQANGTRVLQAFVAASTNNGQSFVTSQLSHNSTHTQITPAIAAFGKNVYVAWYSAANSTNDGSVYVSVSNNNGASWSNPTDVINPSTNGEEQIVATGTRAYIIADGISFTGSMNSGKTWSANMTLFSFVFSNGGAHFGREPWIAASGLTVFTTWNANSTATVNNQPGYQIYGRVSLDGGLTWGPNQTISGAVNNDWEPENVAFRNNAFLTFHSLSNQGIYVTSSKRVTSNTPTWSAPSLISPTGRSSSFGHIFTSDGVNLFVMWGQAISGGSAVWNAYVSFSSNRGTTWSSPIDISNNAVGVAAGNQDVTLFAMSSNGAHCFAAWTFTNAGSTQISFASS
jgi:hypothetical protein